MKVAQAGKLEYECKLCGEVFLIDYTIKTGKTIMEVKPDLADLFVHMWTHDQQREAEQ